jgi:hypothetical protein
VSCRRSLDHSGQPCADGKNASVWQVVFHGSIEEQG